MKHDMANLAERVSHPAPLERPRVEIVTLCAAATLSEPAFNLFLYSGPNRDSRCGYWTTLDQDVHWHIVILPRPSQVAGFEVGTGFYSNSVPPERAAAELRDGPEWTVQEADAL